MTNSELKQRFPRACRNLPKAGLHLCESWAPLVEKMLADLDSLLTEEESARFFLVAVLSMAPELVVRWELRDLDGSMPSPVPLNLHVDGAKPGAAHQFVYWADSRRQEIQEIVQQVVTASRTICMGCGAPCPDTKHQFIVLCRPCERAAEAA